MSNFTHLHVHSEYSVLDGAIPIADLVARVKELGMGSVAVTDHGSMHGCLALYKECHKQGVRPIIGIEAYCTTDPDDAEEKTRDNNHVVLLAMNDQGYKDLLWLVRQANLHNFYYKPRIWYKNLEERGQNLIATTACLGGPLARRLTFDVEQNKFTQGLDAAEDFLDELAAIFGPRLYLELQRNNEAMQEPYNQWLLSVGRKRKLPFIVTTDAHFLRKEDYEMHTLMMAMQFRKTLKAYEEKMERKYGDMYYIQTLEEMTALATHLGAPEAIENTQKIAEVCDISIDLGNHYFPVFEIEKAYDYKEFLTWKEK